jgi:hypothetical protein
VRALFDRCRQEHDRVSLRRNVRFGSARVPAHYNATPSQLLPIITTYAPSAINLAKWGFVPEGWASSRIRPQNNARLETAAEKTMFRSSFSGRHCMVLTDGFYEWHTDPKIGHKQPYRFVMKSGEPFAMAGIYARGEDERAPLTFAILTANERHAPRPRSHAGYLATRPREAVASNHTFGHAGLRSLPRRAHDRLAGDAEHEQHRIQRTRSHRSAEIALAR